MNNKDIKEAFDSLNVNEITKRKILKNIRENYNKKEVNKVIKYKKLTVIAACLAVITGLSVRIFYSKDIITSPQVPSGSPVGDEANTNEQNTTLNVDTLRSNIKYIDIKNHTADTTILKLTDENEVMKIVDYLLTSTEKNMTEDDYLKIADSQGTGNSISLEMTLKDGTTSIVRVNLDLGICNYNNTYREVSSDLTILLLDKLQM